MPKISRFYNEKETTGNDIRLLRTDGRFAVGAAGHALAVSLVLQRMRETSMLQDTYEIGTPHAYCDLATLYYAFSIPQHQ